MFWRRALLVFFAAGTVFGQQIHLKTRNIDTSQNLDPAPSRRMRAIPGARSHRIIQFDHPPAAQDIENLMSVGAEVLGAVPDNSVVISLPAGRILPRNGIVWNSELSAADKLSPALPRTGTISAVVEFHGDVTQAQQDASLAAAGLSPERPAVLTSNHAIVAATFAQLALLAGDDSVGYIFPADPALLNGTPLMPCAGMLTLSGPVPQYANIVHGWDLEGGSVLLNYVFGALTPKQPASGVQSEILRALNAWSQHANVIFQPGASASAARTVYIWFASGAHGDAYAFSGSTGALAHTFYPVPINPESIAGDMHLNMDESWNIGGDIDIYSVALHEAGHALGLGHSDNPGDVMYPYYRRGMTLSANDIANLVALYGSPETGAAGALTSAPAARSGTGVSAGSGTEQPAATPLTLTLNPPPPSTQSPSISFAGSVTGGTAPVTVEWQTDHSSSGAATVTSGGAWSAAGIPLAIGSNNITVTAFDAARNAASQTANVTLLQPASTPSAAVAPVSIRITSPSSAVTSEDAATLEVSGQASGGKGGVARVTWQTLAGATGTATGTSAWVASGIPLLEGTNTIIVRAFDTSGASAWAAVIAVRQ